MAFFLFSLVGHWAFGFWAYHNEAHDRGHPVRIHEYAVEMTRDTLENWQSEFLQLLWQVAGLAYLYYIGSPQSREGHDRLEEKLDYLLLQSPAGADKLRELNAKYPHD